MNAHDFFLYGEEINAALAEKRPMVALESTVIAQGLPWPTNLETALEMEAVVRREGAVPATIAVWEGRPAIGLTNVQLETTARRGGIQKASRRDIALAVAQRKIAATTVAATMFLAHLAGIRVVATGGIGGVHRIAPSRPLDVSADLIELSRIPAAVVCAGAKNILDIPQTLEILESYSVPVLGYQTDRFPAFYLPSSGVPVEIRLNAPDETAKVLSAHWRLGGAGVVIAQPLAKEKALDEMEFEQAMQHAEREAVEQNICGPALTPFLLGRLADLSGGRSLEANQALLFANARLGAHIARALPLVTSPISE